MLEGSLGPHVGIFPVHLLPSLTVLRVLPWKFCYRIPESYCQALDIINTLTSQNASWCTQVCPRVGSSAICHIFQEAARSPTPAVIFAADRTSV